MDTPVFYKNLGKTSKDLLSKDFERNAPSFKFETKAENGVLFSVEAKRTNSGEFIVDPFQYKFESPERGLTIVGKANSNRKLSAEVSIADRLAKGLKFNTLVALVLVDKEEKNNRAAKVGFEYTRENLAATSEFELLRRTAAATAVIGKKGIAVGVETELDLSSFEFNQLNTSASYTSGKVTLTGFTRSKFDAIGGSFFQKVNDNASVAAEVSYKLSGNDSAAFSLGGAYKLDKDTSVKGKVNSDGVVSLSYAQMLRKNVRAVFSTDINTKQLHKDAHQVGFGFSVTDE